MTFFNTLLFAWFLVLIVFVSWVIQYFYDERKNKK
jgi:hypothetical protein